MKEAVANWYKNNSEYVKSRQRVRNLQSQYGITEEQYFQLLSIQNNSCAICKTNKPTGRWKVFAVDHCHTTGQVRGLLCNECNRGIGLLKDSSDLLLAAVEYLEKFKNKTRKEDTCK